MTASRTVLRRATALVLLLLLLCACQRTGSGEAAGFGGTGRAETPFTAVGPTVAVDVAVSLKGGTATLTILDPLGQVRFMREIGATSPFSGTLRLDGNPGRWLAVLDYTDAEGTRSVDWHNP